MNENYLIILPIGIIFFMTLSFAITESGKNKRFELCMKTEKVEECSKLLK